MKADILTGPIDGHFYDGDAVEFGGVRMIAWRKGKKLVLKYFAMMGAGFVEPESWADVTLIKRYPDMYKDHYGQEIPADEFPKNYYNITNPKN